MKKLIIISSILIGLIYLSGCTKAHEKQNLQGVGLLTEGSIHENDWELKSYKGLFSIGEKYDVNVYHLESKRTNHEIMNAIDELVQKGVNLIFGNSNLYGRHFLEASQHYPDVHFVYFNGGYVGENVTSLNFNSHAMGFFSGMIASEMTRTNHIGIIAANEWQAEIEGFYEGAKYQDPETKVHINYLSNLDNNMIAGKIYDQMKENQADVIYPAGNTFSKTIIEQASTDEIYTIGYVADQSNVDPTTVLTSTVFHVNNVYHIVAEKFNDQSLEGGIMTFDFQDEAISFGEFSSEISDEFKQTIYDLIDLYMETNLLPNEQ